VGRIEEGRTNDMRFAGGTLNVGEPQAPPVIHALKERIDADATVILDVPPGTSCPVMAAVEGVDYAVLVAEPTPFGLHDLALIVEALVQIGLPAGLVVNRADIGDDRVQRFAAEHDLPVLAEIPDSRAVAEQQARGTPASDVDPRFADAFNKLSERLLAQVTSCQS
jgi:MinD superfamily P-loop ATPase